MASLKQSIRRLLPVAIGVIVAVSLSAQTPESRLKAAVVSKFPQFVEWPPTALANRSSLDLCIVAPDTFGQELQELVAGDVVSGLTIMVRRVNDEQEVAGCHVLYVPEQNPAGRAWVQRAAALPILTIGDDARFLDDGGIVRLRLVDGRVRFDVSVTAAMRAGLRISSQLLQLAGTVRGRP